jgi:hypothetical protein
MVFGSLFRKPLFERHGVLVYHEVPGHDVVVSDLEIEELRTCRMPEPGFNVHVDLVTIDGKNFSFGYNKGRNGDSEEYFPRAYLGSPDVTRKEFDVMLAYITGVLKGMPIKRRPTYDHDHGCDDINALIHEGQIPFTLRSIAHNLETFLWGGKFYSIKIPKAYFKGVPGVVIAHPGFPKEKLKIL